MNFWKKIQKPFFVLAPMYDVTDAAFRAMVAKYSKDGMGTSTVLPLVIFTEFISADGLVSEAGRSKLLRELYFTSEERPIVAQIFGSQPKNIEQAVRLIKKLGFDGVDINMGCPDRAIEKQGSGAALIKNPTLAREIIRAAKRGAGDLPVSVKTRLGYNKIDIEKWLTEIIKETPAALTVHLRTRKEMSEVPAHWEEMMTITRLAHEAGIVVVGNGDIKNITEGKKMIEKYGFDGVMIGRGFFGKPWLISTPDKNFSLERKLEILVEHAKKFWQLYGLTEENEKLFAGHRKNFAVMRKHFKAYVRNFRGATALRLQLMATQNADEVEKVITKFESLS